MANKCAYGQVTRQMVIDIKKDISEIKKSMNQLSNHYSKRLPTWATYLFMALTAILGGLLGKVIL